MTQPTPEQPTPEPPKEQQEALALVAALRPPAIPPIMGSQQQ